MAPDPNKDFVSVILPREIMSSGERSERHAYYTLAQATVLENHSRCLLEATATWTHILRAGLGEHHRNVLSLGTSVHVLRAGIWHHLCAGARVQGEELSPTQGGLTSDNCPRLRSCLPAAQLGS